MKSPTSVINGRSVGIQIDDVLTSTKTRIWSLLHRISNATSRMMAAVRFGRMKSVLTSLSDEQLELIGVSRNDIDDYARKLIAYEYDGL